MSKKIQYVLMMLSLIALLTVLVWTQFDKLPLGQAKVDYEAGHFRFGAPNQCRRLPRFIRETGLGNQVALDSRQEGFMGLRLINAKGKTWQHPTWDDAGHVGAFERDHQGNIYVAPAPDVSLRHNDPKLQNRIYKIDKDSGEMALFLSLPSDILPSTSNPFGVMGLSFDCDTQSLYATSVAGSSPKLINGNIYQIALGGNEEREIRSQFSIVDAIGVGVFNDVEQKRLYYGEARSSNVYSLPLNKTGAFVDKPRYEFSLALLKGGNTTSARKIQFKQAKSKKAWQMIVKEMEFGFRLPAENNPYKNKYIFRFDGRKWFFDQAVNE